MRKSVLFSLAFYFIINGQLHAQPGVFDLNFSGDGVQNIYIGQLSTFINCIALQADGKTVLGGATSVANNNFNFALARLNPDGSFDDLFGTGGKTQTDLGGSIDWIFGLTIQSDGKIITAGRSTNNSGQYVYALARYNTNGILDTTFGSLGIVKTKISNYNLLTCMALQTDGKIVAAGNVYQNSKNYLGLVRYLPNGVPDSTFSLDGILLHDVSQFGGGVNAITIQTDGKILVSGYIYLQTNSGNTQIMSISRFNTDGEADNSFGNAGLTQIEFNGTISSEAHTIVLQPDEKIIISGRLQMNDLSTAMGLARCQSDGTMDTSFGLDGKVETSIPDKDAYIKSVSLRDDGKIVAAGFSYLPDLTASDFIVAQYQTDGALDSTFAQSGVQTSGLDSILNIEVGLGLAIQPDGKILLGGTSNAHGISIRYLSKLNVGTLNFSPFVQSPLVFPNPVQQRETLKYELLEPSAVTIQLIDLKGNILETFLSGGQQEPGIHEVSLSFPKALPNGMYIIRIGTPKGQVSVQVVK